MPATTMAALKWLSVIRKLLLPPAYLELLTTANDIRQERHASRLGVVHLEAALDRMAAA